MPWKENFLGQKGGKLCRPVVIPRICRHHSYRHMQSDFPAWFGSEYENKQVSPAGLPPAGPVCVQQKKASCFLPNKNFAIPVHKTNGDNILCHGYSCRLGCGIFPPAFALHIPAEASPGKNFTAGPGVSCCHDTFSPVLSVDPLILHTFQTRKIFKYLRRAF